MTRLLVFALLGFSSHAFAARTIVVDKEGGDFATIVEANKEAKPGDTIFIRAHEDPLAFAPGIVYESDGKMAETVALSGAQNVTLRGFRLKNADIEDSQGVVLEQCRVEGGAVILKHSKDAVVRGCAFVAPDSKAAPDRLRAEFCEKLTVERNLIEGAWRGLVLLDSEATVRRNTFVGAHYDGPKLDPNDIADAHDALTDSMAILVQCNPTMMEAWDKRKAMPATIDENVLASNDRGIVVDRCRKGNSALTVSHDLFFSDGDLNYVAVSKEYSGTSFSYVLQDILAKDRLQDGGNQFLDPLFAGAASGDYSLAPESPAARMGKDKGAIGAPQEVAQKGANK